jgi:hypothetical protein
MCFASHTALSTDVEEIIRAGMDVGGDELLFDAQEGHPSIEFTSLLPPIGLQSSSDQSIGNGIFDNELPPCYAFEGNSSQTGFDMGEVSGQLSLTSLDDGSTTDARNIEWSCAKTGRPQKSRRGGSARSRRYHERKSVIDEHNEFVKFIEKYLPSEKKQDLKDFLARKCTMLSSTEDILAAVEQLDSGQSRETALRKSWKSLESQAAGSPVNGDKDV